MTPSELAFAAFENLYCYQWSAQPDGGNKSVIFELESKVGNDDLRVFEASSLEKAFNYAFSITGLMKFSRDSWRESFGVIKNFNHDAWNKQEYQTRFFSIGDMCWKELSDVLRIEEEMKFKRYEEAQ